MARKFSITNSVLNTESLKQAVNEYKITYISPDKLNANSFNFYNVEDVEALKDSISQQGLQQPILVSPNTDGRYTIISGHRRFAAVTQLIKEGSEKFDSVPCRVINGSEDELHLALINANATTRELTDYERMEQVRLTREILIRLRKNGFRLSGRQRDLVAEKTGMSATQVQRFDFISKNLIPDLMRPFEESKIPLTVAESLAKLPEQVQQKARCLLKSRDSISQADVDCLAETKQSNATPDIEALHKISRDDFDYIHSFTERLNAAALKEQTDAVSYERILRLNKSIIKEIKQLEALIYDK